MDSKAVINPSYFEWEKKDQILLSWSMTPSVSLKLLATRHLVRLGMLLTGHIHLRLMPDIIRSNMNFLLFAKVRPLLQIILIASHCIRRLTDELTLLLQPMSDLEIIGCVHDGLDLDNRVVINRDQAMLTTRSFEELYSMLLNREKQLEV